MTFWGEGIEHHLRQLKHCVVMNPEVLGEATDPNFEFDYIDIGSVSLTEGVHHKEPMRFGKSPSRARKLVRDRDVLVSTVRTYLKAIAAIGENDRPQVASTGFAVLRAQDQVNPRYLYRAVQSNPFIGEVVSRSVGISYPAINPSALGDIPIPLPDLATQKAIADFLDRETARIDQLIEKKQRLAVLLGEKLEDDILRAVTLGVDPNAELVPEDELEWTSHRPQHWKVCRLKHFFRENTKYSSDGQETLFSLRMKEGLVPHNDVSDKEILPSDLINYKKVFPGQIVMNRMRAAIGLFGLADAPGIVSPDYSIFDVHPNAHAAYFLRLFKTEPMMAAFRLLSKGLGTGHSGFMRLNADNFGRIRVAVPEHNEQRLISEYVEERIGQVTHLQTKNDQSINRLREYRAALITAAVTGQIDVTTYDETELTSTNSTQMRRLVAAEIVHAHRNTARFGRIKLHKIMFLAQAHANIDELDGHYRRHAAGPYDEAMVQNVESELRDGGFYDAISDTSSGRERIVFNELEHAGQQHKDLQAAIGGRLLELQRIVGLLADFDTNDSEAIVTLYAVWNDALHDGETPDDARIIRGVRHEWHKAKLKFSEHRLQTWLDWMRRNDLVPRGSGPRTISAHQTDLFS